MKTSKLPYAKEDMIEIVEASMHLPSNYINVEEYSIVQDIRTNYYYELRIVLILSKELNKFNCYILDYMEENSLSNDPKVIIENFSPECLSVVKKIFPRYKFDNDNYGF